MNTEKIDFISSYCDRWCERCAFTSRCSLFATTAAIAMCGSEEDGFELALGTPRSADGEPGPAEGRLDDFEIAEPTAEDLAEVGPREEEREARLREHPIMTVAYAVGMLAWKWLKEANEPLSGTVDPVLAEAVEIVQHDSLFITVKLHRALHGRDEHDLENDGDDHPIQNDWNGSAKVALICLERSEAAWRTIAHATTDETPRAIAEQLHDLRNQVNEAFPDAWSFIRPGFDEPDRWRG